MFNVGNNNNNFMSSFFGSNSSFGSGNILGDYSLIKSGVYGKLLKSYYSMGKEASSVSKGDSDEETTETKKRKSPRYEAEVRDYKYNAKVTEGLQDVKSSAESLSKASDALAKDDLYEGKEQEDGTVKYDRSAIKSAVKSFISSYNSYTDSTGKSTASAVMNQNLSVIKTTAANSKMLKELGITYDRKGNLVMDEEKFDNASIDSIKAVFKDKGSYGDTIGDKAAQSYRYAKGATYNTSNGSSYSNSGNYSLLGNSNNVLDQLL